MKPLIKIETVPISIEMKISRARVDRKSQSTNLDLRRAKKGLSISTRPTKLNIDSFNARNTVFPSTFTSIKQFAQNGINAAYEAIARISEEGKMFTNLHLDQDPIPEIAASNFLGSAPNYVIQFTPSEKIDINWEPHSIKMQYEMDKLNFDWKLGRSEYNFVPGSIEFNIKEYNRVIIEYIGGPIYVPPSADPNYTNIDMRV